MAKKRQQRHAAKPNNLPNTETNPATPPASNISDQSHAANGSLDPRTVFVRNVPYTMDTSALEQLFATDVGPVRSAFLVHHKGAQHHAGYGYVQFALQQDATQAVEAFVGKRVQGRLLQVGCFALCGCLAELSPSLTPALLHYHQVMPAARRAPLEERKRKRDAPQGTVTPPKPKPTQKKPRIDNNNAQQAAVLLRTVAVAAPNPIDAAMLTRIRTLLKPLAIVSITDPPTAELVTRCKLSQDGASQHCVLLELESVKAALDAVPKLHRVAIGSHAKGKKAEQGTFWARQLGGEALHRKKWRLIVRNLPFGATEQQLLKAANKVAFVWEVTLPRNEQGV